MAVDQGSFWSKVLSPQGGGGIGSLANATPWGAGFNLAADTISTPNTSSATGGKIGDSAFTFGGIQTGGSQGALGGIPWYAYAAVAAVVALVLIARKR